MSVKLHKRANGLQLLAGAIIDNMMITTYGSNFWMYTGGWVYGNTGVLEYGSTRVRK